MSEHAIFTIAVDNHLETKCHYQGNPGLMLAMLGAVEQSKDWLLRQLQERENPLRPDGIPKHPESVRVPRATALSSYYKALERLRERVQVIASSSEQSTFDVPSTLEEL